MARALLFRSGKEHGERGDAHGMSNAPTDKGRNKGREGAACFNFVARLMSILVQRRAVCGVFALDFSAVVDD